MMRKTIRILAVFALCLSATTARAQTVTPFHAATAGVSVTATAGHTLVAIVDAATATGTISVSDNSGSNTWTTRIACSPVINGLTFTIATADNVAGGTYTVTQTSTGSSFFNTNVFDISGLQASAFDVVSANCNELNPTSTNPVASQTLTTVTSNDFIIGAVAIKGAAGHGPQLSAIGCGPTSCTGTPSTFSTTNVVLAGSTFLDIGYAYVASSAPGLWQVKGTDAFFNTSDETEGALIGLKVAATATPTPTLTPTPSATATATATSTATSTATATQPVQPPPLQRVRRRQLRRQRTPMGYGDIRATATESEVNV
jgi:hypothetical protein